MTFLLCLPYLPAMHKLCHSTSSSPPWLGTAQHPALSAACSAQSPSKMQELPKQSFFLRWCLERACQLTQSFCAHSLSVTLLFSCHSQSGWTELVFADLAVTELWTHCCTDIHPAGLRAAHLLHPASSHTCWRPPVSVHAQAASQWTIKHLAICLITSFPFCKHLFVPPPLFQRHLDNHFSSYLRSHIPHEQHAGDLPCSQQGSAAAPI